MRRTCSVVLCCLAAGAGTLAVPSSSLAVTDSVTCTFSGATSALTDIPGIVDSTSQANGDAVDDALSAIPGNQAGETGVIIENGTYAFGTAPPFLGIPTACLHVDLDGLVGLDPDGSDDTGLVAANINANGAYQNVLCGTGTTTGNAVLTTPTDGEIANVALQYQIAFAAGNGAAEALGKVNPQAGNPNRVRDAVAAGFVHIEGRAATPGKTACGDSDAIDFNVFGTLAAHTITSSTG